MQTEAVIFREPGRVVTDALALDAPGPGDVVVDVRYSGVSSGTERLLWAGEMPPFPGLGYPLVPGYEAVGRVAKAGPATGLVPGDTVFVPGATCFGEVRGLFGAAAAHLVTPAERVLTIPDWLGPAGALFALAGTAYHALEGSAPHHPTLIVGHGVLGRLIARLVIARGGPAPIVWETDPTRHAGAAGYAVTDPADDTSTGHAVVIDASGDAAILDRLMPRIAKGAEIVLAGFYAERVSFAFPPAFMREARIRVAAEWQSADLRAVRDLVTRGTLDLDGLITHSRAASEAPDAYRTAFTDPACLKMIIDWSELS